MSSRYSYYEILEVPVDADASAIRKAYLKKSLKYHPDKNPDSTEAAKTKFIEIGQAYEVLSDPISRRNYDRELRSGGSGSGSGGRNRWGRGFRNSSSGGRRTPYQGYGNTSSSNYNHYSNYGDNASTNTGGTGTGDAFSEETYAKYRDAFDSAAASMSESDVAAVAAFAGMVGCMIGSRILGRKDGGIGADTARGSSSSTLGSVLSKAGSIAGGLVMSEIAQTSVRALHEDSVKRVSHKEECCKALERGEPMPEPPKTSFVGKQLGNVFNHVVNTVLDNLQEPKQSSSTKQ